MGLSKEELQDIASKIDQLAEELCGTVGMQAAVGFLEQAAEVVDAHVEKLG